MKPRRSNSASSSQQGLLVKKQVAQDLIMKAKAGIQQGDFLRESSINFQMGDMTESQGQLQLACTYYKRFYLCARVLNNSQDSNLALNRLGIVYGLRSQHYISLQYHLRHLDMLSGPERFVAKYNVGLAMRLHGQIDAAHAEFTDANAIVSNKKVSAIVRLLVVQDLESMSLCLGQLAIIHFVRRSFEQSQNYLERCLEIAKELDASRMKLDCNLYLAYIAFNSSNWTNAKDYFNEAYFAARQCNEAQMAEQCLCNAGIASGNLLI